MAERHAVREAAARLAERRDYRGAISEYRKLLDVDPNDPGTLLKIADLHWRAEERDAAIATYRRAGDRFLAQGHATKAIAVYTKVRDSLRARLPEGAGEYRSISLAIADLYAERGLAADAVAVLDECARWYSGRGADDEAADILRRATQLSPENVALRLRLAETLSRRGDTGGVVAKRIAAQKLVATGRLDDASIVIDRLLHHQADAPFARLAADLQLSRGTREGTMAALRHLQICLRLDPKDVGALRLLARAFDLLGQEDRAVEVNREIAAIEEGTASSAPLEAELLAAAAESPAESPAGAPARSPVHVVQVTSGSWSAIASLLGQGASQEQFVAFVCTDDEGRDTVRTLYGVVRVLDA